MTLTLVRILLVTFALLIVSCRSVQNIGHATPGQVPSTLPLSPSPEAAAVKPIVSPTAAETPSPNAARAYPPGNDSIAIRGFPYHPEGKGPAYVRTLFQQMKLLGANYVQIVHWLEVDVVSGEIVEDARTSPGLVVEAIDIAHETGLNVYLQLYPEYFSKTYWQKYGKLGPYISHGGGKDPETGVSWEGELGHGPFRDERAFLQSYSGVALRWAREAAAHGVELYSPSCELNVFVSYLANARWHQEILPELRKLYAGNLAQKGEITWNKYNLQPVGDLSFWDHYAGWDYVDGDAFGDQVSLADYPAYLHQLLTNLEKLKSKHKAKGIILGEVGIPSGSEEWTRSALSPDEIQLRFWSMLLRQSVGLVNGFIFWGELNQEELIRAASAGSATLTRAWQGTPSLIRLYYTDSSDAQRQAYLDIHQLIWRLDELRQAAPDLVDVQKKLTEATTSYEQARYPEASEVARRGLKEAEQAAVGPLAQRAMAETEATLRWLEDVHLTLPQTNQARARLLAARQAESQGNLLKAVDLAQLAAQLAGIRLEDPKGDAQSSYGDLKTCYLTRDGNDLYLALEVYDGPPHQAFKVEMDINQDSWPDIGFRMWCDRQQFFGIIGKGEETKALGTCSPKVVTLKASLPPSLLPKAFTMRARIEEPITDQQFRQTDEVGSGWFRVEVP